MLIGCEEVYGFFSRRYLDNIAIGDYGVQMIWVEKQCLIVKKAEVLTKEYIDFREMLCLSECMKDFYAAVSCKFLAKQPREM